MHEIEQAMMRYQEAGVSIPADWESEFAELRERLKPVLGKLK